MFKILSQRNPPPHFMFEKRQNTSYSAKCHPSPKKWKAAACLNKLFPFFSSHKAHVLQYDITCCIFQRGENRVNRNSGKIHHNNVNHHRKQTHCSFFLRHHPDRKKPCVYCGAETYSAHVWSPCLLLAKFICLFIRNNLCTKYQWLFDIIKYESYSAQPPGPGAQGGGGVSVHGREDTGVYLGGGVFMYTGECLHTRCVMYYEHCANEDNFT